MDENWLLRAAAYVELNPVKAGIVAAQPLLDLVGDWKNYLKEMRSIDLQEMERHERTGRPLGNERFVELAERLLGRDLKKKKPGPKAINDN